MNKRKSGEFYGSHYQKAIFNNFIITDTEFIDEEVEWHYHENPYFIYMLQGNLLEANKKREYYLESGSLLFHNHQDAHYNSKPKKFARGFHLEINQNWFVNVDFQYSDFEGTLNLKNPLIKKLMNHVLIETKLSDTYSSLAIESILIQIFSLIKNESSIKYDKPNWVNKLEEIILEEEIDYSLNSLSANLGIHPVHLSRTFSRYFGTNLGHYIRLQKLNKAFWLLTSKKFSLTEICYMCGFYDQSHFISSFKKVYNSTPSNILKKIS